MTRVEFAQAMAYLATAVGKPVSAETAEVYFDLLGDLSAQALQVAVKRVALEHRWANLPTVAELREAAAETMQGSVKAMSSGEAWSIAWKAAGRIDPEIEGSTQRALASVPPLVAEAMRAFGIPALCCGKEKTTVVRAQFVAIYDQLAGREKRRALMPPALLRAIEGIGAGVDRIAERRPAAIRAAVASIGSSSG